MSSLGKFEVGDAVLAQGRYSTVEKVYKNGNFTVAGVGGQWRQSGFMAGDNGYHSAMCEHLTEEVRSREDRRRAENSLYNAAFGFERLRDSYKLLSMDEIKALRSALRRATSDIEARSVEASPSSPPPA